jgi:hypothetical protein
MVLYTVEKIVEKASDNLDIDEYGEPVNHGWRQYRVSLGDSSHEDILIYNQFLAHLEKQHQNDIKLKVHSESSGHSGKFLMIVEWK